MATFLWRESLQESCLSFWIVFIGTDETELLFLVHKLPNSIKDYGMKQILCNFQYICSICTTKDSIFRKWWTLGVNTHYANEIQRKLTAYSWIFQGCGLITKIRKRVEKSKIQGHLVHRIFFAYHMSNVLCDRKWLVYLIYTYLP